jgi:inhibitor of KinA sporulation pathway (predicted exonuclease)
MAKRLDRILVLDLESTCWDGPPPAGQVSEIIEVGICTVDVPSLQRVEKRSILVKPLRSEVSDFCTQLTTLTAEHLKHAGSLADAARILKKEFLSQERLWASWGDYDRRQFERVCKEFGVGYPFGVSHLNVKTLFSVSFGLAEEIGLDMAYERLGLTMEGTHHRGADDAWNVAGLLGLLLNRVRGGTTKQSAAAGRPGE